MNEVLTIPPPKRGIHTYFLISDIHDVFWHEPTVKILLKFARTVPKDKRKLIILGDMLDLPEFMKKKKDYTRHLKHVNGIEEHFIPSIEKSWCWGLQFLEMMSECFEVIYYVEGNHEERARQFMTNDCPHEYRHNFDIELGLELKKRVKGWVKYNDWMDIGTKIGLTHGIYHGTTAHKRHYDAGGGRSVVFGHIHTYEGRAFLNRGETVMVYSMPCASTLMPEYLRGRPNNWHQGFATLDINSFGDYWFNPYIIKKDSLVVNGKRFTIQ